MDIFCCYLCVFNVNFVVIQNISASFSELFPNYVPPSSFASKSGVGGVMTTPQLLWERRAWTYRDAEEFRQPLPGKFFVFLTRIFRRIP